MLVRAFVSASSSATLGSLWLAAKLCNLHLQSHLVEEQFWIHGFWGFVFMICRCFYWTAA